MPTGTIQPEFVTRLGEMGKWLKANGEAIYARAEALPPRNWGAATQKGSRIYVHVLDWSDQLLALPRLPEIKSAVLLNGGRKVAVRDVGPGTVLELPPGPLDPVDNIIVLEKAG